MANKRLFPRYPGSKWDERRYPVWDGREYAASIETYAGSGAVTMRMLDRGISEVWLGEKSPLVRCVWEVWRHKKLHGEFYSLLGHWKARLLQAPDKDAVWAEMEKPMDAALRGEAVDEAELAALSLLYRHANFSGIVRASGRGLNVGWSEERLGVVARWNYELPPLPDGVTVHLFSDAQECAEAAHECKGEALALVDPPYWLPQPDPNDPELQAVFRKRKSKTKLHPAYENHQPHADETLGLATRPLLTLMGNPRVTRIVATNWHSDELSEVMRGWQFDAQKVGRLKQLCNLSGSAPIPHQSNPVEMLWQRGGIVRRQLNLLEDV